MKNLQTIIILVLVAVILWLTQCQRNDCPEVTETIINDSIVYVPKIVTEVVTNKQTVYKDRIIHDTVRINEGIVQYITPEVDYFIKRFYSDTISLDSLGHIIVQDTIFQNKILARKILREFKMQNVTFKPSRLHKTAFYIGFGTSISKQQFKSLTFEVLLTRKKNAYSLGFGFDENFNYLYKGSIYFKL